MAIKEAKDIIRNKLEADIALLPEAERVPVEYPRSVDDYALNHPKAAYLIVFRGGKYSDSKDPNIIVQDRDLEIGVIAVVRNMAEGKTCEEHIDFIVDSISGIELNSFRTDCKIQAISDEWIKEEDGVWWYAVTFKVPVDFIEKEYRDK